MGKGFSLSYDGDHTEAHDDEWATPPSVWQPIADILDGFDLDAAAGCEPEPIADERYTIDDNGLEQPWNGIVWCNPPYSNPREWLEKAIAEVTHHDAELVVMLLPARVQTLWFHENLDGISYVCLRKGKIQFLKNGEEAPSGFPGPVMFVIVGDPPEALVRFLHEQGLVIDDENKTLDDF